MLIRHSTQTKRKASHTKLEDLSSNSRASSTVPTFSNVSSKSLFRPLAFLVLAILIVIGILGGLLLVNNRQTTVIATSENSTTEMTDQAIIDNVSQLIELPADEQPTIATISDQTKLTDYTFFENAENGDKVLIYAKSSKAIIYRPSINRIINSAPINFEVSNNL